MQGVFKGSNEVKLLTTDLAYIDANLRFLSKFMTKMEKITNIVGNNGKS
jgi:hypothetical protein